MIAPQRLWSGLGALETTVAGLAWLGGALAAVAQGWIFPTAALLPPMGLLVVNLAAAMATRPGLRGSVPLLLFHAALLFFLLLLGVSRLTYFKGQAEVTEGIPFDGTVIGSESGPWHRNRLDRVEFAQQGFEIDYALGLRRGEIRNRVRWRDEFGEAREGGIDDDHPLVLEGYRFYPTANKGFAAVLTWTPRGGVPTEGSVHLSSYPSHAVPSIDWTLPGSDIPALTLLRMADPPADPERPFSFRLPEKHELVLTIGGETRALRPGEVWDRLEGRLEYQRLTTWMGYLIHYDPAKPWLIVAAFFAVGCLGWHFARRFARRDWTEDVTSPLPPGEG
ncbi:MAG: hypothetical protein HQL51_03835 [Magnetococcales bacterium]|nr:hypothetical protein [Magnetococcales bacterium]